MQFGGSDPTSAVVLSGVYCTWTNHDGLADHADLIGGIGLTLCVAAVALPVLTAAALAVRLVSCALG